jgi:hypothetical protein
METHSITRISERTVRAFSGRRLIQRLRALGWQVAWRDKHDGTITVWFKLTINS